MRRHTQRRRMGSARNILPAAAAAANAFRFNATSDDTPSYNDEDQREYWEKDAPDAEIAEIWANAPAITAPALIATTVYQFGQEDAA
jgi:hypothetical protein